MLIEPCKTKSDWTLIEPPFAFSIIDPGWAGLDDVLPELICVTLSERKVNAPVPEVCILSAWFVSVLILIVSLLSSKILVPLRYNEPGPI